MNNVVYNKYAETARVNWFRDFGHVDDAKHKAQWAQLTTSAGVGLILKSIKTDYKFVSEESNRYDPADWVAS